jgi:UTP--glucose-1-phosphate uridylyltransferase
LIASGGFLGSAQGEVQLTDAIRLLLRERDVYAHVIEGNRYDTGDKIGYIKAVIDFALEREDLSLEIGQYLIERVSGPKGDME